MLAQRENKDTLVIKYTSEQYLYIILEFVIEVSSDYNHFWLRADVARVRYLRLTGILYFGEKFRYRWEDMAWNVKFYNKPIYQIYF